MNRFKILFSILLFTTLASSNSGANENRNTKRSNVEDNPPDLPVEEPTNTLANPDPAPLIEHNVDPGATRYRPEKRYIEHPNAAKGLIKIDQDKNYIYKVQTSEQKHAWSLTFGNYEPTELSNPDTAGLNYDTIYDKDKSPLVLMDYEYQFFQRLGQLGIVIGGGFFYASGQGQFKTLNDVEVSRPKEEFSLFVFPLSLGLVYRLELWDKQPVVPYGGAGVTAFNFAERRDDDNNPSFGARIGLSTAFDYYGGAAVQLGRGAQSFLDLDREWGINKAFIVGEFRGYQAITTKYDFTGTSIGVGIAALY